MARHRFTERWIRSCRAPARGERLEWVDAACPCLWLRVSGRDVKAFSVLAEVDGRLRRHTIGRYPRWSLADARRETMRLLRAADDGLGWPTRVAAASVAPAATAAAPPPPPPRPTYDEVLAAYIEVHLKPNARSGDNIAANLRHPRLAHLRLMPAADITKRDLVAVLDGFMAAGKPQAALSAHRRLGMMFRWAADRDMIPASPCDRLRPPCRGVERDRILSDAEIRAVWHAAEQMAPAYCAFYRFLFLTGVRRTEAAEMRWRELDGDTWVIPRERVKKDRPHSVPLVPTAIAILATLPRHGDEAFVFTTTGGARPACGYSKAKQQIDRLSGTSGWSNHDIRRSVRSKLAELGVPREVARKILNHEEGKVDRIYNRYEFMAERRDAMLRLEAGLLGLVAG